MQLAKKLLLPAPILWAISSYAVAKSNIPDSNKGAVIPIREKILQMDRDLAKAGGVPPSVLKIDEELLTIPLDSPKAIPLENKKNADMKAYSDAVHQRLERVQAESALYPPARRPSQPQEQQQRMCSVNNGSATYLVPC